MRCTFTRLECVLALLLGLAVAATISPAAAAGSSGGGDGRAAEDRWAGTIRSGELAIAFDARLAIDGATARAAFFNGDERVESTRGLVDGRRVTIHFDHYSSRLEGELDGDVLRGTYVGTRGASYPVELRKAPRGGDVEPRAGRREAAPSIAGTWVLPTESSKGERAFRLLVRQQGERVSAAILRVDGDTGLLVGEHLGDGRFRLQKFDGARGYVLEIVRQPVAAGGDPGESPRATASADGAGDRLALELRALRGEPRTFTAVRPDAASAAGVVPADFATHTRWKDPTAPLAFSFPDLDGRVVSSADPRFAGKVLVVNVTGTWCPNCHDEAPYLAELDRRYRELGLEVVALSFEEPEQLADPARVRAFVERYGVEYTYLLAGEPSQLGEKLPGAENLNAWPTTFFVGRDGRVRGSHTGFAAPASGTFHAQLRRDFESTIEALLAERGPTAAGPR